MNVRRTKIALFFVILALGVATVAVTFANGGQWNSRGVLFGGILCAMAIARLFITFKHES